MSCSKAICKSKFLFSSDSSLPYEFIKVYASGTGTLKSVAIKTTAQIIHNSVRETQTTSRWPRTPQEIVESDDVIHTNLLNLISWIVHSRSQITNNRRVMLARSKAQKVLQVTQNITALLPNTFPLKYQVLSSLTMYIKIGPSDVADTLHHLRHLILYSDILFVKDKWAEWSQYQSTLILSNTIFGVPTTLVLHNIDWKNKPIKGSSNETHHTNCRHTQYKIHQSRKKSCYFLNARESPYQIIQHGKRVSQQH